MANVSTTGARTGGARASHYEYRILTIDSLTSRSDAHRMLTDEAEYGHWELARTTLYSGGQRRFVLRRRIIKVASTLSPVQATR